MARRKVTNEQGVETTVEEPDELAHAGEGTVPALDPSTASKEVSGAQLARNAKEVAKAANNPPDKTTPGAVGTLEDGSKLVRVPPGSKIVAPGSVAGSGGGSEPGDRIVGDLKSNDPQRAFQDPDSLDPAKRIEKKRADAEEAKLREAGPGALRPDHVVVKVLVPLNHDGVLYKPGRTTQLPKDVAEGLEASGIVEYSDAAEPPNEP